MLLVVRIENPGKVFATHEDFQEVRITEVYPDTDFAIYRCEAPIGCFSPLPAGAEIVRPFAPIPEA